MTHDVFKTNMDQKKQRQKSVAKKVAAAAGAFAAITPTALDADIVFVNNRPISLTMGLNSDEVLWDVDGNGGTEMRLFNLPALGVSTTTYGATFVPLNAVLQSYGSGGGVVGTTPGNLAGLNRGVTVGPTLGGYTWATNYGFFALRGRALGFYSTNSTYGSSTFVVTNYSGTSFGYDVVNFQEGNNFFGFRFDMLDSRHFGWAEINFDGRTMTLTRWAYESSPDTAIRVGAGIPEPGSLELLSLGVAGLLLWRKRRSVTPSPLP